MAGALTIAVRPFAVPLTAPIRLGGTGHTERRGVLLRLEGENAVGWGEAAPLPGFSRETLDDAREALTRLGPAMLARAWEAFTASGTLDLGVLALPPSAQAAVEGALLTLEARRRGTTVARLLNPGAASSVVLNGLLPHADPAETRAQAQAMAQQGYRAVKLKVGTRHPAADATLVRDVARVIGPDVALRLDANRAWSRSEALAFADAVQGVPLAYVEEPVTDLADLPAIAAHLPVALDETLAGATPDVLGRHPYARAIVLKPMLLGGVWTAFRWAEAARQRGMVPVVSGAFETGVGMRLNVALAAALGGEVPAGLDPYRWISRDVLPARLPLDAPRVDADAIDRSPDPA